MAANGSWIFAASTIPAPKPAGGGLSAKIGIVWNTINIENPKITIRKFEYRSILFFSRFRSISGFEALFFSFHTKTTNDATHAPANPNNIAGGPELDVSMKVSETRKVEIVMASNPAPTRSSDLFFLSGGNPLSTSL